MFILDDDHIVVDDCIKDKNTFRFEIMKFILDI